MTSAAPADRPGGTVAEAEVVLTNRHGLHLRPATVFAREAMRHAADIRIVLGDQDVNGKSILMLTSLAAERGARLRIRVRGDGADEVLASLVRLVEAGFPNDAGVEAGGGS